MLTVKAVVDCAVTPEKMFEPVDCTTGVMA